jgi:uncharacterized protein YbjT (DUF2867 family)
MACFAPALPLIGGGRTRFQPVYVADVARAILTCLKTPASQGQTYELAGPEIYSFKQILHYIMDTINCQRPLVTVPFALASLLGAVFELLPTPPLTRDQVKLLKVDNVATLNMPGFAHLDISPTAVEMIVPEYLARYHKTNPASVVRV